MQTPQKERRTTAADVARALGLSRATVGFVLNDTPGQTIPETTRQRVLAEARRLGYRPHSAARALASGRTNVILMVLPDWPMDFNLRRNIEEASLALDEAGFALVTYTPHPTGAARPLWESLQPDAVVSLRGLSEEQVKAIREAGVARIVPDPDELAALEPYVEKGPALQVEHLAALDHHRILFAGSPDPRIADLVAARFSAAQSAAENTSIGPIARVDVDYLNPNLPHAVASWRDSGITAVACYNDDIAAAVVGAALRAGLSVPADLAVIGHDDTPLALTMHPQLSTIRVDTAGLGRYTAALALSAVNGSPPPLAGPEFTSVLVVRASTATI